MARLWSTGFELNSVAAKVEFDSKIGTSSISTTTVRGGTYALRVNPTAATGGIQHQFASSDRAIVYARTYFYIATTVGVTVPILSLRTVGNSNTTQIKLTSGNLLQLFDSNAGTQIGSNSSALNANQWYRLELLANLTTPSSSTLTALINGTQFATGTSNQTGNTGNGQIIVGISGTTTTADLFYDDVAINDSSGSFQNSYPGPGSIIHLHPTSAGDNNAFSTQSGGISGSTNNFTRVGETTPDDTDTWNGDTTLNNTDDFGVTQNIPVNSGDPVNVVSVGVRYSGGANLLNSSFQLRIKKTSGGTVSSSSSITPANTEPWVTNANAAPITYPITLYQDPDGNAWTNTTLNSAQIGYIISLSALNLARISTLWMLVDYSPSSQETTTSTSSTSMSSTSTSISSTSSSTSISSTSSSISSTSSSISSTSTSTSSTSTSSTSTSSTSSSTSISSTSSSTSISSTSSSISTSSTSSSTSVSSTSSSTSISTSTSSTSSSTSTSSTSTSTSISTSTSSTSTSTTNSLTTSTSSTSSSTSVSSTSSSSSTSTSSTSSSTSTSVSSTSSSTSISTSSTSTSISTSSTSSSTSVSTSSTSSSTSTSSTSSSTSRSTSTSSTSSSTSTSFSTSSTSSSTSVSTSSTSSSISTSTSISSTSTSVSSTSSSSSTSSTTTTTVLTDLGFHPRGSVTSNRPLPGNIRRRFL